MCSSVIARCDGWHYGCGPGWLSESLVLLIGMEFVVVEVRRRGYRDGSEFGRHGSRGRVGSAVILLIVEVVVVKSEGSVRG